MLSVMLMDKSVAPVLFMYCSDAEQVLKKAQVPPARLESISTLLWFALIKIH